MFLNMNTCLYIDRRELDPILRLKDYTHPLGQANADNFLVSVSAFTRVQNQWPQTQGGGF